MDFLTDRCNRCNRWRIKNLSVCKTLDPQIRPYKGRMLSSGKRKLGDKPMRANEAGQRARGATSSRPGWHLKLPGSVGSDRGLLQLNTKGGVELGDLCMLSVQNRSQHHSPVSGWHLTPTEVGLNGHCFKALLFLSSHRGSARAMCYPGARCTNCHASETTKNREEVVYSRWETISIWFGASTV